MFSENKKTKSPSKSTNQQNRIAEGTVIVGNISSEVGLRIDGEVKGDIKSSGKVVIGKEGKIEGSLSCKNADIEGVFSGNLNIIGLLSLKSTAVITGDVVTEKLAVEPGASFTATCTMGNLVKKLKFEEKTA